MDKQKSVDTRIRELEDKIEQLRFSRRVLMNLVERIEKEKMDSMLKLETLNRKLQLMNSKYARDLWRKNRQIMELETKLDKKTL